MSESSSAGGRGVSFPGDGPVRRDDVGPSSPTRRLRCPCGEYLEAQDDDDLVAQTQAHLAATHPDLEYTEEEILFLAY
jgi:hypothetical protein